MCQRCKRGASAAEIAATPRIVRRSQYCQRCKYGASAACQRCKVRRFCGRAIAYPQVRAARYAKEGDDAAASPLLHTAWRRCVVDEGQHAGSAQPSNRHRLLEALRCERVWILTGTPTADKARAAPDKRGDDALRQVGRLLKAIREPGRRGDAADARWAAAVAKPLARGEDGAAILHGALRAACVRHRVDALELPPAIRITSRLAPSFAEARSLNAFVAFIQANLLLTTYEVADEASMLDGFRASLLNPEQRRGAKEAIDNILLCCAGGGEMVEGPGRYIRIFPWGRGAAATDAEIPRRRLVARTLPSTFRRTSRSTLETPQVKVAQPHILAEFRYLLEKVHKAATPEKIQTACRFFAEPRSSAPCAGRAEPKGPSTLPSPWPSRRRRQRLASSLRVWSRRCAACGLELGMMLVGPCGCLVCPECVRPGQKGCAACGKKFKDVEDDVPHPRG